MRFLIQVQTENDQNWKVTVTSDTLQPDEIPSVLLSAQEILGVDYPTHEQLDGLSLNDVHSSLGKIQTRIPGPNDLQVVGQYLFDILVGKTNWATICAKADAIKPNSNIELALSWDKGATNLFRRFPWEILHDGHHFLAVDPNRVVAITRLVKGFAPGQNSPTTVQISPKVLFVIGSNHHDPVLRPGAEILGLIRRLETVGLGLHFVSQVRVRATKDAVEKAIQSFRPSIVHFICHGGTENNRGYIKLISTEPNLEFEHVKADELFDKLTPDGIPPPLVILNACDTAKASAQKGVVSFAEENACDTAKASAQEGVVSFAEELVLKGVPVVLGMAGEVADSACRFVTRGFYEALLRGKCPQIAVADARKAALQAQGTNPGATIDWSLLTLFSQQATTLALSSEISSAIKNRRKIAKRFRKLSNPSIFCDRLEILSAFQQMLHGLGPNVIAIQGQFSQEENSSKFGKTRLLEEFAAITVESGHIPFYLNEPNPDEIPKNNQAIAIFLLGKLDETAEYFSEQPLTDTQLEHLLLNPNPANQSLEAEVRRSLFGFAAHDDQELPLNSIRAALRFDLQSLQQKIVQSNKADSTAKVIVLLDSLHLFEPSKSIVQGWFSSDGMGKPTFPIPTVFTFSSSRLQASLSDTQTIRSIVEACRHVFNYLVLTPFQNPEQDPFPYNQLLMAYNPPLRFGLQASPDKRKKCFNRLHNATQGIPGKFLLSESNAPLWDVIGSWMDCDILIHADDDDVFRVLNGGS